MQSIAVPLSFTVELHPEGADIGSLERAGLTPYVPQGSYFTLADVSKIPGKTGMERAMRLLADTGIASVPGEAFFTGDQADTTCRFCFGKTDADLDLACRRLDALA